MTELRCGDLGSETKDVQTVAYNSKVQPYRTIVYIHTKAILTKYLTIRFGNDSTGEKLLRGLAPKELCSMKNDVKATPWMPYPVLLDYLLDYPNLEAETERNSVCIV